jgi:hypothetical protein
MPAALQVANYFKQNLTGGAFEALAAGTGDSLTFQDFTQGSRAYLANVMGVDDDSVCQVSLTASRFHDQVLGIYGQLPAGATLAPAGRATSISPPGADQPIYPSDVLSVKVNGTAADNVNVVAQLFYADLPGISGRFASGSQVRAALVNLVGVGVTLDIDLSQGDWSPGVSLSAGGRRLDAGKYYAILGFTSTLPIAAVGVSAFETGNLRVGGSVLADGAVDADLFFRMSAMYGDASIIPVVAGNNQDNVTVYGADPTTTDGAITVMLAELTGPLG